MSIQSAIQAAQQKVEACYTQVATQGGTIPTTKNLANLPQAISTVSEVVPETRFGKGIGAFFGATDSNGVLQVPAAIGSIVFSGVRNSVDRGLQCKFYNNTSVTSANFPDLSELSGNYALDTAFYGCTNLTSVGLDALTDVSGNYALAYAFNGCTALTSLDLSSLNSIFGENTASYMFSDCTSLTSVDLSSLVEIFATTSSSWRAVGKAASNMFYNCKNLASIDLSSLTSISGNNAVEAMFNGCTALTSLDLSALTSICGSNATNSMFFGCRNLASIDLSSLTSARGIGALRYMFPNSGALSIRFPMFQYSDSNSWGADVFNSAVAEIHFRKDMADVVPTFTGYSAKFGAINATIYYDLVGKITVGGVEYMRSEQDSIRSNHVKQYVGWTNKTITVEGTTYTRNSSKDEIGHNSGASATYYPQVYGWTNGQTTIYTTDRLPTTSSNTYTDITATTSAGTISAVSTNDIVYTAFNDTTKAEPDVGTTVYSDAGQTSVGTITAIA